MTSTDKLLIAEQQATIKELRKQIEMAAEAQESTIKDLRSLEHIAAVTKTEVEERYKRSKYDLESLEQRWDNLMRLVFSWMEDDVKPELKEIVRVCPDVGHSDDSNVAMHVGISKRAAAKLSYSKAQSIQKALQDINNYVEEHNIEIEDELDAEDN